MTKCMQTLGSQAHKQHTIKISAVHSAVDKPGKSDRKESQRCK